MQQILTYLRLHPALAQGLLTYLKEEPHGSFQKTCRLLVTSAEGNEGDRRKVLATPKKH